MVSKGGQRIPLDPRRGRAPSISHPREFPALETRWYLVYKINSFWWTYSNKMARRAPSASFSRFLSRWKEPVAKKETYAFIRDEKSYAWTDQVVTSSRVLRFGSWLTMRLSLLASSILPLLLHGSLASLRLWLWFWWERRGQQGIHCGRSICGRDGSLALWFEAGLLHLHNNQA